MDEQDDLNPTKSFKKDFSPSLVTRKDFIYDPITGFILDTRNISSSRNGEIKHLPETVKRRLLKLLEDTESGEIVNKTAVSEDSENRAVDHFTLRLDDKRGENSTEKCLSTSLRLWEECKIFVEEIEHNGNDIMDEEGEKVTDIIINGIGGNILCANMLICAFSERENINIHILSNTDTEEFKDISEKIDIKKTLMFVFSKSGATSEIIGNMLAFHSMCKDAGLSGWKKTVVVTSPNTFLDKEAKINNCIKAFHVNVETGGRNSISSAVGMLICALYHIDYSQLIKGMSYMDCLTRNEIYENNPALLISNILYQHKLRNRSGELLFLSGNSRMREMPHYLQQLFMESLGKEYDIEGNIVEQGITVYGNVIRWGDDIILKKISNLSDNTMYTFINFSSRDVDYKFQVQEGKYMTLGKRLLETSLNTKYECIKYRKSLIDISFRKIDEFSLGMLIALYERVVAFLGWMWRINPFDQPGVQVGKKYAEEFNCVSSVIVEVGRCKKDKTLSGDVVQIHDELKYKCPCCVMFSESINKPKISDIAHLHLIDAILLDMCHNREVSWSHYVRDANVINIDGHWVYNIIFY